MATTSSTSGINVNGISKIKSALDSYKSGVKKHCDLAAKKSLIESAIKGTTSEASLKTMYNQIEANMKKYLTQLNQYSAILDTLKSKYSSNDKGNTTFADVTTQLKK